MDENLHNLEKRLGYSFQNIDLLKEACTHKSFVAEYDSSVRDNQRLEFLGDAVVQIVITSKLYATFPNYEEGDLTKTRAALTREESLADFARRLELGEFIRLGRGEDQNNGRDRNSNLCDAFEAVMGAIYIDSGSHDPLFSLIDVLTSDVAHKANALLASDNPKGELQEWTQRVYSDKPIYKLIDAVGPDHEKTFTVHAMINEELYGVGEAGRLRTAEQNAAQEALLKIAREAVKEETSDATDVPGPDNL